MINKNEDTIGDIVEEKPSANLHEQVAVSAYYKAVALGSAPGGQMNDWLAAKAGIYA